MCVPLEEAAAGHIGESYTGVQHGVMECGTVLASDPPWEVQAQVGPPSSRTNPKC